MLSLDRQNELRELYRREYPGWRPATEVYRALLQERLQPGMLILDLGCGRGGLVEQLGHRLGDVVGLDPDLKSLLEHRLRGQGLILVNGLSGGLPFASSSFDVVVASWVLEHLPQPERDLQEISRVLRPGGAFIFITPNRSHPLSLFNRLIGKVGAVQRRLVKRLYGRAPDDTFPAYYLANDQHILSRLGKRSGLHLSHLEAVPDPTYLAFRPALLRLAVWLEGRLAAGRGIHLVGHFERGKGEENR